MKRIALLLLLLFTMPVNIQAQSVKEKRTEAYSRAKKVMPPDLYLVYRVADRIATTNNLTRPIRVAVRNNVDCEGMLGIDRDSQRCASIRLLPKIDKTTNFDIWAAQVVGTMTGDAGAFAYSQAGTIFLNSMLKELTGKIDQVACVVGHELAHVTLNHGKKKQEKAIELDIKTAAKVSESVKAARNSQNSYIAAMAVLGGINAGLGNSTYSTDAAINNLRISAMLMRPVIMKEALKRQPAIGEAFKGMEGLAETFVSKAMERIQYNLRDYSLEFAAFSRSTETEADLLGTKYVATAGFNPKECIKVWTETLNHHSQDELIAKLLPEGVEDPGKGSSPDSGRSLEEIRKAAMESTLANSKVEKKKRRKNLSTREFLYTYLKPLKPVIQAIKTARLQ